MFGKLEIKGYIEVKTGMHIGGSSIFSAIGAIDSPVIRDVISDDPVIPGSSLKGKIRTLLAKKYNPAFNIAHKDDVIEISRLFGNSDKKLSSRLIFTDLIACNGDDIKSKGINSLTEIKVENTINRATAVANPRSIERVIRGTIFPVSIIYNVEEEMEIEEDIKLLCEGFKFLKYDYIGGHGSRGYGKVEFSNMSIDCVIGDVDKAVLDNCRNILKEV